MLFRQVAIEALQHYPVLRRLDICGCRLGDVESFLLALFKATHGFWIETCHLPQSPTCRYRNIETNLESNKHSRKKTGTSACRFLIWKSIANSSFEHAKELTTLKMCRKNHNIDPHGRLFDIHFASFYLFLLQPIRVAGWRMVGQALDSKSSITELCLADNDLGVKGAMFAIRKVGSEVQSSGSQRAVWWDKHGIHQIHLEGIHFR